MKCTEGGVLELSWSALGVWFWSCHYFSEGLCSCHDFIEGRVLELS